MSEIPGQSGHALPIFQPPVCANFGLMHRSKQLKLFDHFVGAGEQKMRIVISLNWPA
jgi:hypothetical protein